MRRQVSPEKTKGVLEFATQKPEVRFSHLIRNGPAVLLYSYLCTFGQLKSNTRTEVGIWSLESSECWCVIQDLHKQRFGGEGESATYSLALMSLCLLDYFAVLVDLYWRAHAVFTTGEFTIGKKWIISDLLGTQ